MVSDVPTVPVRVLELPISFAINSDETDAELSSIMMVIDELKPPNVPVMMTSPALCGERNRPE